MAIDQALLDLAAGEGRAFLRLYRWAPAALSFGRNEPALRRYDRAAIERLGLNPVRRPTGGRAVWHADELTYAVAAPAETPSGRFAEAYRRIHETLARRAPDTRRPRLACRPAGARQRAGRRRLLRLARRWRGHGGGPEGRRAAHSSASGARSCSTAPSCWQGTQAVVAEVTAGHLRPPISPRRSPRPSAGRCRSTRWPRAVTAAARGWPGRWEEADAGSRALAVGRRGAPRRAVPERRLDLATLARSGRAVGGNPIRCQITEAPRTPPLARGPLVRRIPRAAVPSLSLLTPLAVAPVARAGCHTAGNRGHRRRPGSHRLPSPPSSITAQPTRPSPTSCSSPSPASARTTSRAATRASRRSSPAAGRDRTR